jgi:hypothetical protein
LQLPTTPASGKSSNYDRDENHLPYTNTNLKNHRSLDFNRNTFSLERTTHIVDLIEATSVLNGHYR